MQTKKVLFLYPNSPMPLTIHMMQFLRKQDEYDVELLYYDRLNSPIKFPLSGVLDKEKCTAVRWPVGDNLVSKIMNRVIVLIKFVKKINDIKPDVLHPWNLDMLLAARLATLGKENTKIVFTLQDTTELMLSFIFKALQRWAYRETDLIFVTSQGFESRFLRQFNLIHKDKSVVFVPNVPLSSQFADFKPREPGEILTIGYIGTLRAEEGILTLVEAIAMARKWGGNIQALFAGTGIARQLVERLAEEKEFVSYLGPYHYEEIFELYGSIDVLYAGYDRSYDKKIHLAYRLCEAINCHLPLIVAEDTHMSEIVEIHDVGGSVELGNIEDLAQTLIEFWHSPEKRNRLAQNCEKARPRFVFEYYQKSIRRAYASVTEPC